MRHPPQRHDASDPESNRVCRKTYQPCAVHVKGDHFSLIPHELCKMGCLSAITCTEIQDGFACNGGKKDGGQLSGFVLNLKKAFLKGFVLVHPSSEILQPDSLRRIRGWFSHNTLFCFKPTDENRSICLERVGSDGECGDPVLCFEQGFCKIDSPLPDPFPHQPFRIGIEIPTDIPQGFCRDQEKKFGFCCDRLF